MNVAKRAREIQTLGGIALLFMQKKEGPVTPELLGSQPTFVDFLATMTSESVPGRLLKVRTHSMVQSLANISQHPFFTQHAGATEASLTGLVRRVNLKVRIGHQDGGK